MHNLKIPDEKKQLKEIANALSNDRDADLIVFNFGIEPGFDLHFLTFLRRRNAQRKNLIMFLTTEGGDADAAYRIARHLQDRYANGKITIVVAGWCKSAGTLICIGANELIINDVGELGPLDVQIAKTDEMGERSSGLAVEAAFEKLQEESFKLFQRYLTNIKDDTGGRITFKTAAEMSANMTVGMMSDIFAKIDPLVVGEDYRSNLVAEEYALRLNTQAKNLTGQGLHMLVRGYPSHRFVIDKKEASDLFRNVSGPTTDLAKLITALDAQVIIPRNESRNQMPLLEFLNDAAPKQTEVQKSARAAGSSVRKPVLGRKLNGASPNNVSGDIPKSTEQKS